jgi:hypothetical protein
MLTFPEEGCPMELRANIRLFLNIVTNLRVSLGGGRVILYQVNNLKVVIWKSPFGHNNNVLTVIKAKLSPCLTN